jgi:hypothetical protein
MIAIRWRLLLLTFILIIGGFLRQLVCLHANILGSGSGDDSPYHCRNNNLFSPLRSRKFDFASIERRPSLSILTDTTTVSKSLWVLFAQTHNLLATSTTAEPATTSFPNTRTSVSVGPPVTTTETRQHLRK